MAREQTRERGRTEESDQFLNLLPPFPLNSCPRAGGSDHRAVFSCKSLRSLWLLLICGLSESKEVPGSGRKCLALAGRGCQSHFSCQEPGAAVSPGFLTPSLNYSSETGLTGPNWGNGGGRAQIYPGRETKRKREKHKIVSRSPFLNTV